MGYYYIHPLDSPDFTDQGQVYDFITNDVGLSMITPNRIKDAVKTKTLLPTKISGNNHYTRRNVLKWLESIGIAIDWRAAETTAKHDYAARELAEASAALDAVSGQTAMTPSADLGRHWGSPELDKDRLAVRDPNINGNNVSRPQDYDLAYGQDGLRKYFAEPNDPMKVARQFLQEREVRQRPLINRSGEWLSYETNHWKCLTDRRIEDEIRTRLEDTIYYVDQTPEPWKPTPYKTRQVVDMLSTIARLDCDVNEGGWFNGRTDLVVPCRNKLVLVDLRDGSVTTAEHTPECFNRYVVNCDYDSSADSTLWRRFCAENLGGDLGRIQLAEDWGGHVLSGRTSIHKFLIPYGPTRSGKGTYVDLCNAFFPDDAHMGLTIEDYVMDRYGPARFKGKSLINFSDQRNKMNHPALVQFLLRITGEDEFSFRGAYGRDYFYGKLPGRVTLSTNLFPVFEDDSNAIAARALLLEFPKSFADVVEEGFRKDICEPQHLSGVLNRFLDGLVRIIRNRNTIAQPAAGADILAEIATAGSPIKLFLTECCNIDGDQKSRIIKSELFHAFHAWCITNGYSLPKGYGPGDFASSVYAASNGLVSGNGKIGSRGEQKRAFVGLRLKGRLS